MAEYNVVSTTADVQQMYSRCTVDKQSIDVQ